MSVIKMTPEELEKLRSEERKAGEDAGFKKGHAEGVEEGKKAVPPASVQVKQGDTFAPYKAYTDNMSGLLMARSMRMAVKAKREGKSLLDIAEAAYSETNSDLDGQLKHLLQQGSERLGKEKAMTVNNPASAGYLVNEVFATELIALLRADAVVRSLGAQVLPMPGGKLTFNAQDVGAVVHYKSETANIVPSQPGFNQDVKLAEKELVGLVPMSYRLLDNADYSVDVIVRDDLAAAMASREDIAFIRGDGTADTPTGMRNRVFPAHVIPDPFGATPSLQDVRAVFANMMLQMRRANMPSRRLGYIISPRTEAYLMTMTDGLGNPVFEREMIASRTIRNIPYRVTTQLPEDLGVSGVGTEIYLADFSQLIIGESKSMEFDVLLDAAYDNGAGTIVAGASSLQAVVRVVARHDFNTRYRKAIVVQSQVEWGS